LECELQIADNFWVFMVGQLRFDSRSQLGWLANLSTFVAAWFSSKIVNHQSSVSVVDF
jgi:hypothetical protein